VDLSWNSTGYETVYERVVFSLLGLAFERKQIPRLVGNVSSSGDTFRFARHPDQFGTIVSACVGRSAMPTYRYESDGTNFVFTLTTEIIARSAELPQGQFPFHFPH